MLRSNVFLHDFLKELVYIEPLGFVDSTYTWQVCLLNRFLYGWKQEPCA